MRNTRTKEEQFAIDQLSAYLNRGGKKAVTDPAISDCPDWAFDLDGQRIGCECATLGRQEIIYWHNQPLDVPEGTQWHVTYPIEPHMWLQTILNDKTPLADKYRTNARSQELWLLLHEKSADHTMFRLDPYTFTLLRFQATEQSHPFSQIWLLHAEDGLLRIYRPGLPRIPKPKLTVPGRYPTAWFRATRQLSVPVGTHVHFDFRTLPVSKEIILEPLDEDYRSQHC